MPSTFLLSTVVSMVTKGSPGGWNVCFSWPRSISPSLLIHRLQFTEESDWKASKDPLTFVGFFWKLLSVARFPFFDEPFMFGVWGCSLPS